MTQEDFEKICFALSEVKCCSTDFLSSLERLFPEFDWFEKVEEIRRPENIWGQYEF